MKSPRKNSRPVRRAGSKNQSRLQKFFANRYAKPALFAGLFALIGAALLIQTFAQGGRPSGAKDIVLQYRLPHAHHAEITEGADYHSPSALLYGDGKLFCSKETADSPFDLVSTKLTPEAMDALYQRMLNTGFTDLEEEYSDTNYVLPAAATNLMLNTSEGAKYVSLMTENKPEAFVAMEDIIVQLCGSATTAYEPAEIELNVTKLDTSESDKDWNPAAGDLPAVDDKGRGNKKLKGKEAKELARQLKKGGKAKLKKDGSDYLINAAPVLPEAKIPEHKTDIDKGKVSAAAINPVKFIWVYGSDQMVVPNAQSQAQDVAGKIQTAYQNWTSKSTTLESVQVKQLPKPVSWYYTCRNSNGCKGADGTFDPTMALFDNLFNSYEGVPRMYEAGKSVNILAQFTPRTNGSCGGWGTALSSGDPVKDNVGGFAITYNASGCYTDGYTHGIAAHEQGHTMGLGHTTDNTLMGNSGGCPFTNCKLNSQQASKLKNYSPYLYVNKTTTATAAPKLNISQEALPGMPASGATVKPGQEIGVRLRISNSGTAASLNTIIENAVPGYMSASWQGGVAYSGSVSGLSQGNSNTNPITYYWWKMSSFGNSASAYIDMKFRVRSDAPNGATVCNTGSIRADNYSKISTGRNTLCFKISNTTTSPTYPPPANSSDAHLSPGERLYASSNQTVYSPNRSYFLRMQSDGNLVLYTSSGSVKWQAGTTGLGGAFVTMQSDGNLVMYKSDGTTAVWHTGTRSTNAWVKVQDDAKFVIYNSSGTSAIWNSGSSTGIKLATYTYPTPAYGYPTPTYGYPTPTYGYPTPTTTADRLTSGSTLSRGGVIYSANRNTKLVLQSDGNLVLYYGSTVRFATYTSTGYKLAMQSDCNLVLYNSSNQAVWNSGTYGRGSGCFLKVQDDARMAIYNSSGTFIWGRP